MMVRPELPYSPGMEVMGVVDACGAGAEEWSGSAVVAMPRQAFGGYRGVRRLPGRRRCSRCPTTSRSPTRRRSTSRSTSHGSDSRTGRARGGEQVLVHAAAGGAGSAAVQLAVDAGARCSPPRAPTRSWPCAGSSARASRSTRPSTTSPPRARGDRRAGRRRRVRHARWSDDDVVARRDRVQRSLRDDRRRSRQGDGRRAVHRPSPGHGGQRPPVRCAARLRRSGDPHPREAGDGLQLPPARAR